MDFFFICEIIWYFWMAWWKFRKSLEEWNIFSFQSANGRINNSRMLRRYNFLFLYFSREFFFTFFRNLLRYELLFNMLRLIYSSKCSLMKNSLKVFESFWNFNEYLFKYSKRGWIEWVIKHLIGIKADRNGW